MFAIKHMWIEWLTILEVFGSDKAINKLIYIAT